MFNNNSNSDLENELATFNPKQLELIMSNLIAIQLTQGCSVCCVPGCGLGAQRGVRDKIPFSLLERIYSKFSLEILKTKPILYFASEPFDYEWKDKDYLDAHKLALNIGYKPYVSTAFAKKKERKILDLIMSTLEVNPQDIEFIDRKINLIQEFLKLSETEKNKKILKIIEEENIKPSEYYSNQLLLKLRFPKETLKDFQLLKKQIIAWPKSNIVDRISMGVANDKRVGKEIFRMSREFKRETSFPYNLEPIFNPNLYEITNIKEMLSEAGINFEEELHNIYFPQKNIIRVKNGRVLLAKHEGIRQQIHLTHLPDGKRYMVSFDGEPHPIEFMNAFVNRTNHLNIMFENKIFPLNYLNLGPKHKDNLSNEGINCSEGTLLTPKGVFNIQRVIPTQANPYDFVKTKVSAENFKVQEYKNYLERPNYIEV